MLVLVSVVASAFVVALAVLVIITTVAIALLHRARITAARTARLTA